MPQTVSFTELTELVTNVLIRHDVSLENAGPVADSIVACERDDTASHGLLRLPGKDFDSPQSATHVFPVTARTARTLLHRQELAE